MGSARDEGEGMGKYGINIAVPRIGQVRDKVQGERGEAEYTRCLKS